MDNFQDDELLQDFLEEAYDILEVCKSSLVDLENNHETSAALDSLFRGVHTIKGGCGMFSYTATTERAHELETFLATAKESNKVLSNEEVEYVSKSLELIEDMLRNGESGQTVKLATPTAKTGTNTKYFKLFYEQFDDIFADFDARRVSQIELRVQTKQKEKLIALLDKIELNLIHETAEDAGINLLLIYSGQNFDNIEQVIKKIPGLIAWGWIKKFISEKVVEKQEAKTQHGQPVAQSEMLRVPLDRVNQVLDNAWELFLVSNQLSYLVNQHRAVLAEHVSFIQAFEALETQLKRNIKEVESRAMTMRMSTVSKVFSRMEKIVQGYVNETGKMIDLVTMGENVELDKKVIDMLGEPLVHLIRNAMDHGIEKVESRVQSGKAKTGKIELKAEVSGNRVNIIIKDDGKGMCPDAILESAKRKGLDTSHVSSREDALNLIFTPGFSTVAEVSNVSGRGVGMDAVKNSVTTLGGSIELQTTLGVGTTFKIQIPMGMSVISALVIDVNGYLYALDSENVIKAEKTTTFQIKKNGQEEYYMYNGNFIPCISLQKMFYNGKEKAHKGIKTITSVCVLNSPNGMFAIQVDEVLETIGLVAKPCPNLVPGDAPISGVSLLQSGQPVIILAVEKIEKMGLINKGARRELSA